MKKMLKDYDIFISELYRTDKPYIIFYIVMIILKAASPFALIIFPKYLLNEITGLNRIDYIIRYLIARILGDALHRVSGFSAVRLYGKRKYRLCARRGDGGRRLPQAAGTGRLGQKDGSSACRYSHPFGQAV